MDCYKEFAHLYDELINSDIDYKSFGKFILSACDKYSVNKEYYMDLACGTGNLTREIYKSFKYNFGIDMSVDMLTEAEKKLDYGAIKPKFICQDICDLDINRKFDLITCCLDSVNYITEEDRLIDFFMSVEKHLKPQGLFIFDINSYYKISQILGNNTYTYDDEKVFYVWENRYENEIVDMYLTFFMKDGDMYSRIDEGHSERAYNVKTLENIFEKCGLKCFEIVDCYENKPVTDITERITFVVKLA